MVIVPLLVLVFGVDLPDAVGTSLVAVIATSSGAAAAYVREGYSNIRIGMVLEVATTIGAVAGALLALVIAPAIISIIFGVVLLISAYLSARHAARGRPADAVRSAGRLPAAPWQLSHAGRTASISRRRPALGFCADVGGGRALRAVGDRLGGLQGPGHGPGDEAPLQGVDDDQQLHDRSDRGGQAGVDLNRGYIAPELAMPVVLGVLAGSALGTRILVPPRCGCCGSSSPFWCWPLPSR